MKYVMLLLFFNIHFINGMQQPNKKFKLKSNDGKQFELDEKYLKQSGVLQLMNQYAHDINTSDKNDPILLPNTTTKELELFITSLKNSSILSDKKSSKSLKQKATFEVQALQNSRSNLYAVMSMANYLNIPNLLEQSLQLWAEKKYLPTQEYPLPFELENAIAQRISYTPKLIDNVVQWRSEWLVNNPTCLLYKSFRFLKPESFWSVGLSDNGKLLTAGCGNGGMVLCDLQTNEQRFIEDCHKSVSVVRFFAKDTEVWSCGNDGTIKIWDFAEGLLKNTISSPLSNGFVFAYFPDRKVLVTDAQDNSLCFWDLLKEDQKPETVSFHQDGIQLLEASDDNCFFISGGKDNKLVLWDIEKRSQKIVFDVESSVMGGRLNKTNENLMVGLKDGTLKIYDVQTTKQMFKCKEHSLGIWSIVFVDEDQNVFCTGSRDSCIKFWDSRTKHIIGMAKEHTKYIHHLASNPETYLLASASHDQTVKLWDIRKLAEPLQVVRKDLEKNMNIEQVLYLENRDQNKDKIEAQPYKRDFQYFLPETQEFLEFTQNKNLSGKKEK